MMKNYTWPTSPCRRCVRRRHEIFSKNTYFQKILDKVHRKSLPSEWAREFFAPRGTRCEPSPACGRGRGEGLVPAQHRIFEGGTTDNEGKTFVGADLGVRPSYKRRNHYGDL